MYTGVFLFSGIHNEGLNMLVEELIRYEDRMENYNFYWKISLSLYSYYKFKKDIAHQIKYISKTYEFIKSNQSITNPIFKAIAYEYQ